MKSIVVTGVAALALVACGGGGDAVSFEPSPGPGHKARGGATPGLLVPQRAVVAHPQVAGDQVLVALGTTEDGGYGLVWLDGTALLFQRFDVAGQRVGPTHPLAVQTGYPIDTSTRSRISAAVLLDGRVVVAYEGDVAPFDLSRPSGIFIQRFSTAGQPLGTPVLAIVNAPCDTGTCGWEWSWHSEPVVLALPSGGFIVASRGGMALNDVQRFDADANPSAPLHRMPTGYWAPGYRYKADAHDGFTAYMQDRDRRAIVQAGVEILHYDAQNVLRHRVVSLGGYSAPSVGVDELLWLGNRYAFVSSDYGAGPYGQLPYLGTYSQTLNATGQSAGERRVVPVRMGSISSVTGMELTDGTHVLIVRDPGGQYAMQQYDLGGIAVGRPMRLQAPDATPSGAPLADGGFVAAWTAGTQGALDVFVQRFIDDKRDHRPTQARRMACLAGADAQGLRGAARQGFVRSCMTS